LLSLSDEAAQLIRTLLAKTELPATAGLRLCSDPELGSLQMSLSPYPLVSDSVVAHGGASLFVSEAVAVRLADQRLHAQVEDRPAFFVV
jgi:hypothetical protein